MKLINFQLKAADRFGSDVPFERELSQKEINSLFFKEKNSLYWCDNTPIQESELNQFSLIIRENGTLCLEHNIDDFGIEIVNFSPTRFWRVEYDKKVGGTATLVVRAKNAKEALKNAYHACYTGANFRNAKEVEPQQKFYRLHPNGRCGRVRMN